jgi:dihydropteroate synthase
MPVSSADNQKYILVQDSKKSVNVRGRLLHFDVPVVMGILNITPDSFYSKSRFQAERVVDSAGLMLETGAKMLDIGGYSTRPGAVEVSLTEEMDRLLPVVDILKKQFPDAVLSIDTYRTKVAEAAVLAGADIINDVSGGTLDPEMFETVARLQVPYILMHMRGNPETMQQLTQYDDLVTDIIRDLAEKIMQLRRLGASDIITDPGFGRNKQKGDDLENIRYRPQ